MNWRKPLFWKRNCKTDLELFPDRETLAREDAVQNFFRMPPCNGGGPLRSFIWENLDRQILFWFWVSLGWGSLSWMFVDGLFLSLSPTIARLVIYVSCFAGLVLSYLLIAGLRDRHYVYLGKLDEARGKLADPNRYYERTSSWIAEKMEKIAFSPWVLIKKHLVQIDRVITEAEHEHKWSIKPCEACNAVDDAWKLMHEINARLSEIDERKDNLIARAIALAKLRRDKELENIRQQEDERRLTKEIEEEVRRQLSVSA